MIPLQTTEKTLHFYFDFISPYAYLAWTQMPAFAARARRRLQPLPILFAGCLNAWGHKGPAEIPPKRLYVMKNACRIAHGLGVPITAPPTHPFNPLLALRIASIEMPPDRQFSVIDALFRAAWVDGYDISDPGVVRRALAEASLDAGMLLERAGSVEIKARLRARTEQAISAGVFGVPTVDVDGELFWGVDSLAHAEACARGEDPVDPALAQRWANITASAQR